VNDLTQLLSQSDEPAKTKKCSKCGEVKLIRDFAMDAQKKDGLYPHCRLCKNKVDTRRRSTEHGYLKERYDAMNGRSAKRLLTLEEFLAAWEKHKSLYGMKSAWGPGLNHLDQHLPVTMIYLGENTGTKTASNLSVDRLDNNRDYTVQNIIFIRGDENMRKKDTTYNDCLFQIKLHEERFGK
tara:strand:+ start:216 stop:761 length:546 start_codon:yes stop_codon:yes gene_type:complete